MTLIKEVTKGVIFFRLLSIFNAHTRRGKKVLKKLIVAYIQKGFGRDFR